MPSESDLETRWLSISGGPGFGFLIRRHAAEDARTPYDSWAQTLDDAMAHGDAYGIARANWHRPDPAWLNAPPPARFREEQDVQRMEIERRRLSGEISKSEATRMALALIQRTAEEIVDGVVDPLQGSLDIYESAWFGGGWDDDDAATELQRWGAVFIQLHDELERHRDDAEERKRWISVTRETAIRGLAGEVFPDSPESRG